MTGIEFKEKWLATFCKNVSQEIRESSFIDPKNGKGLLWHAFSYNCVPYLENDEAREEYNKIDKTDAFAIKYEPQCNWEEPIEMQDCMTAEQIEQNDIIELYVIGKDFSWCYVYTHERKNCGPYFCYAKNV